MYPVEVIIFSPIFVQIEPSAGNETCGVGVGLGDGDAVGVGVGMAEGVGVGSVGLKTGFISGLSAAFTETPLFQINFLPDLIQVYLIPAVVLV